MSNHSVKFRLVASSRRRLRSVTSSDLIVPATRRSTIGDRAFAVAGQRAMGTSSRTPFVSLHHWPLSNAHSRLIFFCRVFFTKFSSDNCDFVHRPWSDSVLFSLYTALYKLTILHYITFMKISSVVFDGMVWYGIVEFNVPLDTV